MTSDAVAYAWELLTALERAGIVAGPRSTDPRPRALEALQRLVSERDEAIARAERSERAYASLLADAGRLRGRCA